MGQCYYFPLIFGQEWQIFDNLIRQAQTIVFQSDRLGPQELITDRIGWADKKKTEKMPRMIWNHQLQSLSQYQKYIMRKSQNTFWEPVQKWTSRSFISYQKHVNLVKIWEILQEWIPFTIAVDRNSSSSWPDLFSLLDCFTMNPMQLHYLDGSYRQFRFTSWNWTQSWWFLIS